MKISNILLTTSLIAISNIATANDINKYYISLTGEYIASADSEGDISAAGVSAPINVDFQDGWGGMLAAGYYITPELRAELEGGYRELKGDNASVIIGGTTYIFNTGDTKGKALTAMTNLYYDIYTGSNITPYIGAGMGLAHQTNNGESDAFAYQGMAGISYKVNDTSSIYSGYRYFRTTKFTNNYNVSGVNIEEKIDIKAHAIDVGYRYSF